MQSIYKNVEELIGNTPIMELCATERAEGSLARIYAKLEFMNPMGSVKDRAALNMLNRAEEAGLIGQGSVIIEPTSGNTGIGLAGVAGVRGYKTVIVMPDSMSKERITVMRAYGAEVVLTPGAQGMAGAIAEAKRLAEVTPGSFIPSQFENPANAEAHYLTTGPEIYADMDGNVDIFVAGAGTGGTVSGVGRYLKEKKEDLQVIAVEPQGSAVLSGGSAGKHKLQGIGAGFVPKILDRDIIDGVIAVSDGAAYRRTVELAKNEGLLVGISSGAALDAAITLSRKEENRGKNIVVLLPDTGLRYLSEQELF